MSLINDVLIELDWQSKTQGRGQPRPASPPEVPVGLRKQPIATARSALIAMSILGTLCGLTVAILAFRSSFDLGLAFAHGKPSATLPSPAVSARPPVSPQSAPPERSFGLRPTPQKPLPQRLETSPSSITRWADEVAPERPRLEHISLVKREGGARLRLSLNDAAEYWIEGNPARGEVELIVADTLLDAPLETIELAGTLVESLDVQTSDLGLHLRLGLSGPVKLQSQLATRARGAMLLLDLIPVDAERAGSDKAGRREAEPRATDVAVRSVDEAPARGTNRPVMTKELRTPARDHSAKTFELAEAVLREANTLRGAGKPAEARVQLRRALTLAPHHEEARRLLALMLVESGERERASTLLDSGLALAPRSTRLRLLKARILDEAGQPDRAIAIMRPSPPPIEEAPDYHALMAGLYQKTGEHDAAADTYARVLRIAPRNPTWWMGLGVSLESAERQAEALSAYQIAGSVGSVEPRSLAWMKERIRSLSNTRRSRR